MKSLLIFLFGFGATAALGQSHLISISTSYHYNEDEFYLTSTQPTDNTSLELAGNGKFSLGAEYHYMLKDQNSWFVTGRVDYAYRSYDITSFDRREWVPSFNREHRAQYIDLMLGGGKQLDVNKEVQLGAALLPGIGIPLQKAIDDAGSPTRLPFNNVDRLLPFLEFNLSARLLYSQKSGHAWSIGIAPFVRAYLNPLYENVLDTTKPPYMAFGASVKLGLHIL